MEDNKNEDNDNKNWDEHSRWVSNRLLEIVIGSSLLLCTSLKVPSSFPKKKTIIANLVFFFQWKPVEVLELFVGLDSQNLGHMSDNAVHSLCFAVPGFTL